MADASEEDTDGVAEGRGNNNPPCPAQGSPQEHARAPQDTGVLSAP